VSGKIKEVIEMKCPTCQAQMEEVELTNVKGKAYLCPNDPTHWEVVLDK